MICLTLLCSFALVSLSDYAVHGSPLAAPNPPADTAKVWQTYMNKAMNRKKQVYGVAPRPDTFDNFHEANTLRATHSDSHLIIAYGKWALADVDTVYAFASDSFNQTISDAVISDSVVTEELRGSETSPQSKRDHPFSWGDRWRPQPTCTPGYPCEDVDDCRPFNCDECWEEVGVPKPRSMCGEGG